MTVDDTPSSSPWPSDGAHERLYRETIEPPLRHRRDEIDWLYHQYRIFSFTFELYPKEQGHLTANVYPPYSVVARRRPQSRALLYLIDAAACPYASIGKGAQYCVVGLAAALGLLP